MKLHRLLVLLPLIPLLCFFGCINKHQPNTIIDKKSLSEVLVTVDSAFTEKFKQEMPAVFMATPINLHYLENYCGINPELIEEYAGSVSYSITNSDTLIAVKAVEGSEPVIVSAFKKRLSDLTDQYERFSVNQSYERALAGEVHQLGSYIFLIVVGVDIKDLNRTADYSGDVQLAVQTINSMFYQS